MRLYTIKILTLVFFQFSLLTSSGFGLDPILYDELLTQEELIDEAFEKLKNKDIRLSNHGYVCEELAMIYIKKLYDPELYTVHNGIVYKGNSGVIGELDVVIINNETNKAIMIGEVKCKTRVFSAIQKAKKQLKRFTDNIGTKSIELYLYADKNQTFERENFLNKLEKRYISFKGTTKKGFSDELLLTLDSVKSLLHKLKCYKSGHYPFCN